MRIPKPLVVLLAVLVLADMVYSFGQHLQAPLDGDMAAIIWPSEGYRAVLHDPLGLGALLRHEIYAAPNRYVAHQSFSSYFKAVPLWLQAAGATPLDSVYLACALAKTLVQAALLYLLAAYCSGTARPTRAPFVVAAALLTPLFQTAGYNNQLGLIDRSITYTWFYALPSVLLLLFFWPFYRAWRQGQPVLRLPAPLVLGLAGLAVVLALHGPLVPGVVLLVCPLVVAGTYWRRRPMVAGGGLSRWLAPLPTLPWATVLLFGFFSLVCLYSLYIGTHNAENLTHTLPLAERYQRLPQGFFSQLTQKLGTPIVLAVVLLNAWLIRRKAATAEGHRLLTALRWLGVLAVVYMLLLPLGGYREYRPHILRRDTLQPVLLGLFFAYGATTLYLLQQLPAAARRRYVGLALGVGILFAVTDRFRLKDGNACERQALAQLAQASTNVVPLPNTCTIMSWFPVTDPGQSAVNVALLHYWGVLPRKTLYVQPASAAGQ
ncbi:hypothetical protein [Hymenobacter weizhouensis]|uniref:hypothetical protein n=1 Tax=Hymenobacter sp. YIM 151500-1 TaxID=2987689 RepID=UPI0022270A47|nr:hypothetical protein [Hymenobacter sp. YIM 151500-1]UYZ62816.1 hypothetical protein OIS53_17685 [Hymenobacter sp. YIM 151500-1]